MEVYAIRLRTAIKRNNGVGAGECFFPESRPNISLLESAKLAKQMDRAARGKPAKSGPLPVHHPTDNSDADLKALDGRMGITPPPPGADQQENDKDGHR